MSVDDGGVERLVSQILTDLPQADACFEEVSGVAVAKAVGRGSS